MSNPSPARRLRTKTSELSGFFRGTSQHQPHQVASDVQLHSNSPSDVAESPKKRNSRIPFLGRTRKKSAQSDASSLPSASEHETQDSTPPVGTTPKSFPDGHTVLMISSEGPSHPPLPSTPITVSPPSLGSKFAAHFTSSKPRKHTSSPRKTGQPSNHAIPSDSLSPSSPSPPRSPSFDSTSSGTSRNRSPTPRPSQPTITVSLSPENLEEYGDLFTLPRQTSPQNSQAHLLTPGFENVAHDNDDMKNPTSSPTPPTSSRTQPSNPPFDARRASANLKDTDPTLGPRDLRGFVYMDERPSASLSKGGRQSPMSRPEVVIRTEMDSGPPRGSEQNEVASTPNLSPVIDISPWNHNHNQKRRSVTMPYKSAEQPSSSPRSIMKPPSAIMNRPNGPPTIPLPPPPSTSPPLSSMSAIPSFQTLPSRKSVHSSNGTIRRPRAYTTSSVPNFPRVGSSSSSSSSVSSSPKITKGILRDRSSPPQNLDKDNLAHATLEQLKQELKTQNLRFDELASHVLKITEKHVAEKTALEKKIESLEREAVRREKEIKGLTWLVINNRGQGGPAGSLLVGSGTRSASALGHDQVTQRNQPSGLNRSTLTGRHNPDDSGTESRTSGPESPCGSGAESRGGSETESRGGSGTESPGDSSIRAKKLKKRNNIDKLTPQHRSSNLGPVGHTKTGLGIKFNVPDMPYLTGKIKRSSVSSFSSSAASSTSSLSSPSMTAASSTLSAIPEAHSSPPKSSWEPAAAAESQREKEERRASRAARRISSSSLSSSSSSTSASNNYASNLKRGRPPSIAQVLEQSPSIDRVLEKLQPFGGTTTPSAI